MSKFEGSFHKVRCVDCTKLFDNRCMSKKVKVSSKKRRLCNIYLFKGEFDNRKPLPAVYLPPVDKKVEKMFRKLQKMGITTVPNNVKDMSVDDNGQIFQKQKFEVPKNTATDLTQESVKVSPVSED